MAKQTFTTGQVLTAAQMTSLQQTAMLGGAASAKTASYTLVAADAGGAISMSNASATTITVNTGLFAAGDTVQITNLGAGVCTITSGTATVNSAASLALAQYESGTLDFTSTSAAIFIKGAGAAAASGGMTLLSTTSITGTSVTLSSISQSYRNLYAVVYSVTNDTSNRSLLALPNNSSTASQYVVNYKMDSSSQTSYVSTESSQIPVIGSDAAGFLRSGAANSAIFQINNYTAGSTVPKIFSSQATFRNSGNTFNVLQSVYGAILGADAITSLVIRLDNSANMTAGTILLYGVS